MENTYSVYMHLFPNGKRYIGMTKDISRRWAGKSEEYSSQPAVYQAMQEFGWDAIEHIIIQSELTKSKAASLESQLIATHNTTNIDFGYNMSSGGVVGYSFNDAHGRNISRALRGRKLTLAHRQHIKVGSANHIRIHKGSIDKYIPVDSWSTYESEGWARGSSNKLIEINRQAHLGISYSESAKCHNSIAQKKHYAEHPERRQRLSEAHTGKVVTEETRKKMSESFKQRRYIHKNGVHKVVPVSQLDSWIADGWERGKGKRERNI